MTNDHEPMVRLPLLFDKALAARIEEWRYEHRIPSRAAAIRALIESALAAPLPTKERKGK